MDKQWVLKRSDETEYRQLAERLDVHPFIAKLLLQRDIDSVEDAERFLRPSLSTMRDPYLFAGMEEMVEAISEAIIDHKYVAIHGDYDVDGLSSTALMSDFLTELGVALEYHIPRREGSGYGLSTQAIEKLHREGVEFLITVDCGVRAVEPIERARQLGMDVVVIDHHKVSGPLPPANAVVDPMQPEDDHPFKHFCAVGLAFHIGVAVRSHLRDHGFFANREEPKLKYALDLVALGTIADSMPLRQENRVFVRRGLELISRRERPGIRAMLRLLKYTGPTITTQDVQYKIAPRLNAAGRMGDASFCVELLTTENMRKAEKLAGRLEGINKNRRQLQREIVETAEPLAREQYESGEDVVVVHHPEWPPGIIGIVASRLAERFNRPSVVVGQAGGQARGSARGIQGVDVFDILSEAEDLFFRFGGHEAAAGFAMDPQDLQQLKTRLHGEAADGLSDTLQSPSLTIDGMVDLDEFEAFSEQLEALRPFGPGNKEPTLVLSNCSVESHKIVGKDHLRVQFQDGEGSINAIGFSMAEQRELLEERVAAVFSPHWSYFQGEYELELRLEDLRPASGDIIDRVLDEGSS